MLPYAVCINKEKPVIHYMQTSQFNIIRNSLFRSQQTMHEKVEGTS